MNEDTSFRLSRLWFAGVVIGGLLLLAFALPPRHLQPGAAALSVAIAAIGLLPLLAYVLPARRHSFPFLPLIGVFYALFFGLATLLVDIGWPHDADMVLYDHWQIPEITTETMAMATAALILLLVSFAATRNKLFGHLPRLKLPRTYSLGRLRFLLFLLLILHLAILLVPSIRQFGSLGQISEPAAMVAFGMFLWLRQRGELSRAESLVVFCAALPVSLLYRLAAGGLADVFMLPLFLMVLSVTLTRRIPWAAVIVAGALFLLAYNITPSFRYLTWNKADPEHFQHTASLTERLSLFSALAYDYVTGATTTGFDPRYRPPPPRAALDIISGLVRRLSLAVPLEYFRRTTPAEIPYWDGATYRNLGANIVPRLLWPGKPTETIGGAVAERYNLPFPDTVKTSINLAWLTELYVNFGTPGVLIGMVIIGMFLAALDRIFNDPDAQPLEMIFGASLIFRLFYQESNFTVMTGSLLSITVVLWLFFRLALFVPRESRDSL
jgi:hypothetical protein